MRPSVDDRQVANFLWSPNFEASCDGRAIRDLPRPSIPWAPLASLFKRNLGAQEKRKCSTVVTGPDFDPSTDWTVKLSSTSSPLVADRVMLFSVERPQAVHLRSGIVAEEAQLMLFGFAAGHWIEQLGIRRLDEDRRPEEQSSQRDGHPRSSTTLTGSGEVP